MALPTPAEQKRPPAIRPVGAVRRAAGMSQLKRPNRTANAPSSLPTHAEQKRNLLQTVLPGAVRRAAGVIEGKPHQQNRQRPVSAPDPRGTEANPRKPSCWRSRQTAGVIRMQNAPAEPPTPRHRSRPPRNRNATSRKPSCWRCAARGRRNPNTKRPNRTTNAPSALPTHDGTEVQPPAIRPAWHCTARGRREPTQTPQQNRQRPVSTPDPRGTETQPPAIRPVGVHVKQQA